SCRADLVMIHTRCAEYHGLAIQQPEPKRAVSKPQQPLLDSRGSVGKSREFEALLTRFTRPSYILACNVFNARNPSCATSLSVSLLSFSSGARLVLSPLTAKTRAKPVFSSLVPLAKAPYSSVRTRASRASSTM